jgi:hypothetical protein
MTLAQRMLSKFMPVLAFLMTLGLSAMAFAAKSGNEEEMESWEGRLEGYTQTVRLENSGSTAPYWLLLIGLGVVALIVLFKDAKRTHLD